MHENDISFKIRGVVFDIHKKLGPGLLESVYEEVLFYELTEIGFKVDISVMLTPHFGDIDPPSQKMVQRTESMTILHLFS